MCSSPAIRASWGIQSPTCICNFCPGATSAFASWQRKTGTLETVYFWGRALFRRDASCPSLSAELFIFDFAARTRGELEHRPACVRDWRIHLFLDASATSSRRSQFFFRRFGYVWWLAFSPHFCRTSPASAGNDVGAANFLCN